MERTITIEEERLYQEDYQIRMLQDNKIKGFLDVRGRGADEKSFYDYDVSGKISIKALFEKNEMGANDIRLFLANLIEIIEETQRYLLDIHHILLKPEYIYYGEERYFFCYYPPDHRNLWEEFHILTEFFVKRADYRDQTCVQMVFLLHKETMEENYSLEKTVMECLRQEDETEEKREEECKGMEYDGEFSDEYDRKEHDWIAEQEMGSSIMKETENMWTPVKRFLNRHKKPRWGDFDGLYIEEEEL